MVMNSMNPEQRFPRDRAEGNRSRVLSCDLCFFLFLAPPSGNTSAGQVQTVPGCSSQGPSQRAAEEEEDSGAAQRQGSARYSGEDTVAQ